MFDLKENYKFYIRITIAAVVVWFIFSWFKDILSGEEGRVRRFILQGKKAVESRNILSCADKVSISYNDKYGNEKQSLIYIVKELFDYYKKLSIGIERIEIKLDDSKMHASAQIVALVIGESRQNKAEKILEGEKGRFRVKLVKEENRWRLSEIEFFEPVTIMQHNIS